MNDGLFGNDTIERVNKVLVVIIVQYVRFVLS